MNIPDEQKSHLASASSERITDTEGGMTQRLTGEQFGVRIVKRPDCPNDAVQLISEDDGNWFEHGGEFDAAWIDDMITVLQAAKHLTRVTYRTTTQATDASVGQAARSEPEPNTPNAVVSPAREGWVSVPIEPTAAMWEGLARDLVMWRDMGTPTGAAMHRHFQRLGRDIPDWLAREIPDTEHVPPKGTVAVCIYKAMLSAAPEQQQAQQQQEDSEGGANDQ